MGIRDAIRSMRASAENGSRKPLALTEAALEGIRERIEAAEDPLAFFVLTQPSDLGFNVGVGFEPLDPEGERTPRDEFPVPVVVSPEDWEQLAGFTIDFRDARFVTTSDVTVHVNETPNPESRKFIVNRKLIEGGTASHSRPVSESDPALVRLLFQIPQVKALFFADSFVSVTQTPGSEWTEFVTTIGHHLQGYFAHGGLPLSPPPVEASSYTGVERKIVEVLEDVVRPAVQKDGGDIAFAGYEEGTVQLYMLGSCVGCPSSMATLKMGVENLLKDSIPEVKEVVAID